MKHAEELKNHGGSPAPSWWRGTPLRATRRLIRAMWLCLLATLPFASHAQTLINVDFGVGTASAKTGFAGTGQSTNDFWNLHRHYSPKFVPGMAQVADGKTADLRYADGSQSPVVLTVNNAPGVWGNASGDAMFDTYIFAANGSNLTVTLTKLEAGRYHFFLYGHADADVTGEQNSVFSIKSGTNTFGPLGALGSSGWKAGQAWQEHHQFVVFRDVVVEAGKPVVIEVAPGANGVAVLNGLQIISRGTSPPRLATPAIGKVPATSTNLLFREIRYTGSVSDTEARFEVALEVESLTTNEISAPFFEGDVAVIAPTLPEGLRIVAGPRKYRLICNAPGVHALKFEVVAKITRAEPWNQVTFTGPEAAVATITAVASAAGVEMQLLKGTQLNAEEKAASRLTGVLGADRAVSLRWQSKAAEVTRKSLVTVDTTARVDITPTVVKFNSQFRYEILQAGVPRLTLALPASHALTKLQGEQIRDWKVETSGERQLLTVEFIKPIEKSYALTVLSEQTVDTTPLNATLQPPQPLEVERESGSLSLYAEDMLVDIQSAPGLRQVNASGGAIAAYRFNARPFSVETRLRRVEPVVKAHDRVAVRLEEARLLAQHSLTVNVEKTGIYALELAPQTGFIVTDVRGEGMDDWKIADGKVRVSFGSKVLGRRVLTVQLEQAFKAFPNQVEVLPLRVTGATNETVSIGVASAPGIRVKTSGALESLREVPVTALGQTTGDEQLGFTSEQGDWKLTLAAEKLSARVIADVFNLVTIGDGLVGGSATIRYVLINQGVQEFKVRVPAHWKNVEFTGTNIRRKESGAPGADTNYTAWTISLQDKAWNGYTLVVTYDYQFDPKKASINLAGLHTPDAERETGSLAVTTASSLQLKPGAATEPLRQIDPSELAAADRALITRPVYVSYRYTGSDYHLTAELLRHDESQVLDAVTDRTQLTSVLTEAGEMLTQASFMVKNNDRQFQKFRLPPGGKFWSAYVNNEPVKAEIEKTGGEEWLLISLPRGANRDEAFAVDIVYAEKLDALNAIVPRPVALQAPKSDIPNTYAEWQLYVPTSQRLSSFGGNMTVARGTTYGWREAWSGAKDFYRYLFSEGGGVLIFILVICGIAAALLVAAMRKGGGGILMMLGLLAILAILAGMLMPALAKAKAKSVQSVAINNLKQIGLGAQLFADDHGGRFPSTLEEMSSQIGNENILTDPQSGERFTYVGAGKSANGRADSILAFGPATRGTRAVALVDGSVQQVPEEKFAQMLQQDAAAWAYAYNAAQSPAVSTPAALPDRFMATNGVFAYAPASKPADAERLSQKVREIEERKSVSKAIRDMQDSPEALRTKLAQLELGKKRLEQEMELTRRKELAANNTVTTAGRMVVVDGIAAEAEKNQLKSGDDRRRMVESDLKQTTEEYDRVLKEYRAAQPQGAVAGFAQDGDVSGGQDGFNLNVVNAGAANDFMLAAGQPLAFGGGGFSAAAIRGEAARTVAGLRSIRIELPKTGHSYTFTKVLNLKDEPLAVSMRMMKARTYDVFRTVAQVTLFLLGLIVCLRQWGRGAAGSSFTMAIGATLALASVIWLLIGWHALHLLLIVVPPMLALLVVSVLAKNAWRKWKASRPAPPTDLPPTDAGGPSSAVTALLIGVCLLGLAGNAKAQAVEAPTNAITLVSATYTGAVKDKVASFTATFTAQAGATNQIIPLFGEDVAVEKFTAEGDARLVRQGRGVALHVGARGNVTVKLNLLVKLGGDVSKRRLTFAIPPALATKLNLTIDEGDADVEFPSAVAFKRTTDKVQTSVEAVLGAGAEVELNWTPRVKRVAEMDASVFAQTVSLVTLGNGVVNTRTFVDYQIAQGELRQARVRLPQGQRLLRVEGEMIRTWEVIEESGENTVIVDLVKGAASSYRLTLELEKILEKLPTQVKLDLPQVTEVKRTVGLVAVRGGEELSLIADGTAEFQRIELSEFSKAGGDKADGAIGAWRYLKPGVALSVRAEAVQPQVEAVVKNTFRVGFEQLWLGAAVDYTIKKAGVFTLRLAVPEGWKIESVTGNGVQQWSEKQGPRTVEVTLKERTLGAYNLRLNLSKSHKELPKTADLAGVQPLGVQKLSGFVAVAAEAGISLKTTAFEGMTEIPAATLPDGTGGAGTLAYKFIAADPANAGWKLAVAIETMDSWVRAEVVNVVSVTETLVSGRTLVRYEIQNAPAKEFRLRVPAGWTNVEINGVNIRRRDQTGQDWRIELQNKVRGLYTLQVTWEMPGARTNAALKIGGVETIGTERETGFVTILAKPPLQVTAAKTDARAATSAEQLVKIDASELPQWASLGSETPVLSYRYLRPGFTLGIEARRFEEAAVLAAIVDSAHFTTVVADDGQMMTELSLSIRNNGLQHLELELPEGALLWSAFVAGEPVRPTRPDKGRPGLLLLPLERTGEAACSVELSYVNEGLFPKTRGKVALASPKLDLPLKNARWDVYLPPDYDYTEFAGSMQHEASSAPVVVAYSLSEYSKQEGEKKAAKFAEVQTLVSNVKSQINSGKMSGDNRDLNRLRGNGLGAAYGNRGGRGGGGGQQPSAGENALAGELESLQKQVKRAQSRQLIESQNEFFMNNAGKLGDGNFNGLDQSQVGQNAVVYDAEVAEQQWERLEKAQAVTAVKVQPLRVNLPTRGVRHAFTQVLQTETKKPLFITVAVESTKDTGWWKMGLWIAGGFVVLWIGLAVIGAGRRERR